MTTIKVRGYQSIRDEATIVIEGFTVLTGESNRGKSAFIRAVKSAFSNKLGNSFITIGEESCEVSVIKSDHSMSWEKSKKGAVYTIDGKRSDKVGRNLPDDLALLGIKEIVTQDKKHHWPQIQGQQYPIS